MRWYPSKVCLTDSVAADSAAYLNRKPCLVDYHSDSDGPVADKRSDRSYK